MTLYELEQKLALYRAQGVESNAQVRFDLHKQITIPIEEFGLSEAQADALNCDSINATAALDDALSEVSFERNGRHEIVLR